uniref:Conserved hypothetical plastid protein n=1 Tax=Calliarthron tuberculosum TaxID=48942 RepID=M4IV81_CALTB|nr:conserved hypothetical plastid protein [Calliarthron tuberculosum]AGA63902.1 conserved hypothetical plastid protein [Calliarthron tuberculosum]
MKKLWENNMLSSNNNYYLDQDVEFLLERPIGWSSACLDSTIDYYLNCNQNNLLENEDSEKSKIEY